MARLISVIVPVKDAERILRCVAPIECCRGAVLDLERAGLGENSLMSLSVKGSFDGDVCEGGRPALQLGPDGGYEGCSGGRGSSPIGLLGEFGATP